MTLIRDVLARDITGWEIPNLGVAKVGPPRDEQQWRILRHELESFVADGEYGAGLERMLTSYLGHLERDSQPAAWVSGFYGSGKSHLVRVLDSLWNDRELPDGARASGVVQLPASASALFKELDTRSRQFGGRFSAAGTLAPGGSSVGLSILSIVFAAAGLPEEIAPARLVLWLRKEGLYEPVVAHLTQAGKSLEQELTDLYVSDSLAEAIVAARPTLANSAADMLQLLRAEYPSVDSISDHALIDVLERTLRGTTAGGDLPLTLIVLDECQQFIGDSSDRSGEVQLLAEAISSQLKSRVMVVGTGQMALRATPMLQRLRDRFTVEVQLSDKDVDHVVRSVVLRKRPERKAEIEETLERVSGEIDRQLAGSSIGPIAADKPDLAIDYPLLPARRRLWERLLRTLDTSGRSGQLRTQLRLVLDATKAVADRDLGVVVAVDRIYDDQESGLLQSGALPPATAQLIAELDDGSDDGRLAVRVAKVVYLLNRLPQEGPLSTGLRPVADTVADVLIEDLRSDGAKLRERVPLVIASLVKRSVLQALDGGSYILQTPEGAEWDAEFQAHQRALAEDSRWLAERRDALLREAFAAFEKDLHPRQGTSRIPRKAKATFSPDQPATTAGEVPIWVRDEWSTSFKTAKEDAQRLNDDDPLVLVWIPREHADALKSAMVEAEAAVRTVDRRAVPATQEGKDARQGLVSRREAAREAEKSLAERIVRAGRVFQAGGNEVDAGQSGSLAASLANAVDNAVIRLYPSFGPADSDAWPKAMKRIRDGAAEPLAPLGYRGEVDEHVAGKQVLAYMGPAGKRGQEVRKAFEAPPYGWSGDAIDTLILALVATGKAQGRYNGAPIDTTKIPQNQLGSGDYRAEDVPFPPSSRMKLKGLARALGVLAPNASDGQVARAILDELRRRSDVAGGDPPLPARPSPERIRDLEQLSGNAQLAAIADARDQLETLATDWDRLAKRIPERRAGWDRTQRLLRHADRLSVAADARAQLQAIEDACSLLEDPDPVAPVTTTLTDALRTALAEQLEALRTAQAQGMAEIHGNPGWGILDETQQQEVLSAAGMSNLGTDSVGTPDEILRALDEVPLGDWSYRIDAVPAQVNKAFLEIQKRTAKAPTPVAVPKTVIKDMTDLDRYFDDVRTLVKPHLDADESVVI